ncbi:MAG: YicC family protein [Candidatus Rokubacteria bacterium]|nr:YicC family protein [Candidatus Rokubacteria bacterium]
MIRSMTGYGRAEAVGDRLVVTAECKSLNHRHLDIALKLPRVLGVHELDARRLIQGRVQRGRIDVVVTLSPVEGGALHPLSLSLAQAREYLTAARRLASDLGKTEELPLEWVLGQPGVLAREEAPAPGPGESWALLELALTRAMGELLARREAEGTLLGEELGRLLEALAAQTALCAERAPVAVRERAARLTERIQALLGEVPADPARLATEVAVMAERSDVTEELARLRAHLAQFRSLVGEGGPVGRTLDFLIQEMHREVNTLGAKADDLEISPAVIAAKSTLEKLREQVQNVE